jgi:hypothetical protein
MSSSLGLYDSYCYVESSECEGSTMLGSNSAKKCDGQGLDYA